jgi:hypothetical protein
MKRILVIIVLIWNIYLLAEQKSSWHFYPILDYSDETSLTGGAASIYLYRPEGQDKSVPPSMVKLQLDSSIKGNLSFESENEWQLEDGKYAINLPLNFEKQKCELYKTGNELDLDIYQKNEFRHFSYSFEMLRRWEKYEFGFTYKGSYYNYDQPVAESVLLAEDELLDAGGWSIGPGLTFQYNTLNNHYFPLKGLRMRFIMQTFSQALRSDHTFERYSFSIAKFIKLAKLSTWASELKIITNAGVAPFQETAALGNELRIFHQGQFADKYLISIVSEIRSFPFERHYWRRFGFVAFGEAGQVQGGFDEFYLTATHYGFGIGCRYLLDMEELFTIRLDSGFYKSQSSFDFGAKEAF